MAQGFQGKRDYLASALRETVLTPTIPDGSYFIVSDSSKLTVPAAFSTDRRRDYNVCRWLTKEVRASHIPRIRGIAADGVR